MTHKPSMHLLLLATCLAFDANAEAATRERVAAQIEADIFPHDYYESTHAAAPPPPASRLLYHRALTTVTTLTISEIEERRDVERALSRRNYHKQRHRGSASPGAMFLGIDFTRRLIAGYGIPREPPSTIAHLEACFRRAVAPSPFKGHEYDMLPASRAHDVMLISSGRTGEISLSSGMHLPRHFAYTRGPAAAASAPPISPRTSTMLASIQRTMISLSLLFSP